MSGYSAVFFFVFFATEIQNKLTFVLLYVHWMELCYVFSLHFIHSAKQYGSAGVLILYLLTIHGSNCLHCLLMTHTSPEEMSDYIGEHAELLHNFPCITCTSVVKRWSFRLDIFSVWVFHACPHKHHWWWRALVSLWSANSWSGNNRYYCQQVRCRGIEH